MSLARKAVAGAIWTIATSMGGRAIGLVGSLVLSHYLARAEYGDVHTATLVLGVLASFTSLGFGQYLVANPKAGDDVAFHATVYYIAVGMFSMGLLWLFRDSLGGLLNAPNVGLYIPGVMLAFIFERIAYIPGRILVREMRFKIVGMRLFIGEVLYAVTAISLAAMGWGAASLVYAMIVRSCVTGALLILSVDRRRWLSPCRLSWETTRRMLAFGAPMNLANMMHFLAVRGDNLLIVRLFGPATVGTYNYAYQLADIPASQIGEHIGDVLLPSFAKMDDAKGRMRALVRASGLLALVVFPLAVGLGAIAETLVATIFDSRWAGVAPMLLILSVLSVFRPVGWLVGSYLQALSRTRTLLFLETIKSAAVLGFILIFGRWGVVWACAAIGIAFASNLIASVWVIYRQDGLAPSALIKPLVRPLLACGPMVAAVLGVRALAESAELWQGFTLGLEVLAGALGYVAAAFTVAGKQANDLLKLLKDVVKRRRSD